MRKGSPKETWRDTVRATEPGLQAPWQIFWDMDWRILFGGAVKTRGQGIRWPLPRLRFVRTVLGLIVPNNSGNVINHRFRQATRPAQAHYSKPRK